jgi:NAD(P)H-nitrite reductase large subunit
MGAYIIIGSSAAGLSAAQTIRRLQPDREIIVLSKDKAIYSRCMLHKLLSGERSMESIEFESINFFQDNRINFMPGTEVVRVDEEERVLILGRSCYSKKYWLPPGLSTSCRQFQISGMPKMYTAFAAWTM